MLETPQPLKKFREIQDIYVILHRLKGDKTITLKGIAPFHTLEDLHRAIWLQEGKDEDLYPKYSYLAIEDGNEIILPATYTFVDVLEEGVDVIEIPDPRKVFSEKRIQESFVESDGEKKPVGYRPRGRITIEDFFKTFTTTPVFHLFPFTYCKALTKLSGTISKKDWYGLFYPYFPALDPTTTGQFTETDLKQSKLAADFTEAKLKQVALLDELLKMIPLKELHTTQVKHLSFQWISTENQPLFDGVDELFFALPVDESKPFMRLLTPNTTPMTKLYRPDSFQPPQVNDPVLLKTWVDEPNPDPSENILFVKFLIRKQDIGTPPLYGTLRVMDDTTATFSIQPQKEQRVIDFQRDLSRLPTILEKLAVGMPFKLKDAQLGRASLKIELPFETKPEKNIKKQVAERLSHLNSLFQLTLPPTDDEKPFLTYRYKAVSNFTTDDRISSFITYVLSRQGVKAEQGQTLAPQIANEFQISEDEAMQKITTYFEKASEVSTADVNAREFLILNNKGIDISLSTVDIKTFAINLFNIRAISIQDILRICTIMSLVFYGTDDEWDSALLKKGITSAYSAKAAKTIELVEQEDILEEEQVTTTDIGENDGFFLNVGMGEETTRQESEQPPEQPEQLKAKEPESTSDEKIVAYGWFINRLKKLDPKLFDYKVTQPGQLHYSSKCANNEDRYPLVLTAQQYQNMRKIYEKDVINGEVGFIVYGERDTKETIEAAKGKIEKIHVMRYGSDPNNLYYFLCHGMICLRDLLPILAKDWVSDKDYYKKTKPVESCPFCHGTEIKDREHPAEGQTVFIRLAKPRKQALYIRFLDNPDHPAGYDLPCCFIKEKHVDWSDQRFKFIRDAPTTSSALATEEENENKAREAAIKSEEFEKALKIREQLVVSYDVLRWKAGNEYILGPEKYPLEPGKIGLPSLLLDSFLGQESSSMVKRFKIKMEFKPSVHGFFRLGVLNKLTYLNQSLFAALAPLLGLNTISEVENHLTALIKPKVFLNLNFGNLVLEFFDPSDPNFPPPSDIELANFAKNQLSITNMNDTRYEISRFYRSYHRFISYIKDPTKKKQLRHFVHALAEPDLLAPNGLTILTLHYMGDPRDKNTRVEILCPMMGFDTSRYANNSIGFLTYSDSGIWEPLIYVDKIDQTGAAQSDLYFTITQQQMQEPSFPCIVRDRYIDEFLVKCRSAHIGAFTYQSGVDSRALLPFSKAVEVLQSLKLTGIVKDIYNHLIAITLKNPVEGKSDDILVPVVDDGNVLYSTQTGIKTHLGLKSIYLASANDVYSFYEEKLTPMLLPLRNVYKIESFLMTNKIIGFRLGGADTYATILLPCGPSRQDGVEIPQALIEARGKEDFQFEYMINHDIITAVNHETYGENDVSAFVLQKKQIDILYEHLRLSFSNWIANMDASGPRKFIENLIGIKPWIKLKKDPNYVKMRALKIEFGSVIASWFAPDDLPIDTRNILLKNDCIAIEEEGKCTNTCKFTDGKCKIHIPEEIQVRSSPKTTSQDAITYFTERLFDEIIRLPAKRSELMTKTVKRIQIPSTNVHVGNQWILPENVPAWYDLLRGSSEQEAEKPQYYEEFGRTTMTEEEEIDLEEGRNLYSLPQSLLAELDPASVENIVLEVIGSKNESRSEVFRRYFGIRQSEDDTDTYLSTTTLTEISKKYRVPVIQVQVNKTPLIAEGRSDASKFTAKTVVYVLVPDFSEGPALLVMKNDASDTILGSLLRGKLYDSIQTRKIFKRTKITTNIPLETNE